MPKLKIGSHSSISNGLERALYNVKIIGGDAVQIFSKSPRSRVIIPKFTENDMECTKDFIKNNDTYLVIHSSYLVLPVKGIETKFSANSVIEDMKTIGKLLDKSGCIIHMKGKNKDMTEEEAEKNLQKFIKYVINNTPSNTYLILENTAGQKNELFPDISDFCDFYEKIPSKIRKRVRICIDTCHAFAAGNDISSAKSVKHFFNIIETKIGINKITCIHLNDSLKPFDSHVDRHEDIGHGQIPITGLKAVVKFAKKNDIPMILETTGKNDPFEKQVKTVKKWAK